MNRASKTLVVISAGIALGMLAVWVNRAWSLSIEVNAIAFAAAAAASFVAEAAVIWILVAGLYLMPALVAGAGLHFDFTSMGMWLSALFGAIVVDSLRRGWSVPARFRAPIALWGLIVSAGWPIAVLRELDFRPSVTAHARLATSRIGTPPPVAVVWILCEALTILIALLWFDWLAARIRTRAEFQRRIVTPFLIGIGIASGVAVVQGLVSPGWLNRTVFGASGRAAGTLLDGNAYGMLAAMWLPATLALALRSSRRLLTAVPSWLLVLAMLIGLWSSGSRTAVLAGAVALLLFAFALRPSRLVTRGRVFGAAALVVAVVTVAWLVPASTVGPWQRVRNLIPRPTFASISDTAYQLWDRDHYGGAAVSMIRQHPYVGVGVGGFNLLAPDFAYINGFGLDPDNAQNWFRQELAELGTVGSLGWIWWALAFAGALFGARARDADLSGAAARAGLVGMAAGSLLGMPAQNVAVALTFMTLAAWWLCDELEQSAGAEARVSGFQWTLIVAVVAVFAAGTYVNARGELRPARRAVRGEWSYETGVTGAAAPDGSAFTRTGGHSVQVQRVHGGRYLKFTFWVDDPNPRRPVRVRVWRKGTLIANLELGDNRPVTYYVHVPSLEQMMMIETDSSGQPLAIAPWTFVGGAPPGVTAIR